MRDSTTRTTEPLTGAEYLANLRDSREVYIYGDRFQDVTIHPAFCNTERSVAPLFHPLHDEARRAFSPLLLTATARA